MTKHRHRQNQETTKPQQVATEVETPVETDPATTVQEQPHTEVASDIVSEHVSVEVVEKTEFTPEQEVAIAEQINSIPESVRHSQPAEVVVAVPVAVPSPYEPVPEPVAVEGNPFTTPAARLAYEELHDYLRALSRKVTPTQQNGAALQAGLHRALLGALNAPAEEFDAVMEHFLAVFRKEAEGLFSARNRFRWVSSMTANPAGIENFKQLVTLFAIVAEPKSRALAVRQTPWQSVLGYRMIKEESRQRVMAFFGV